MSFIRKHPNIIASLFGLVVCLVLIVLVELSIRVIKRANKNTVDSSSVKYDKGYHDRDEFGISLANEGRFRAVRKYKNSGKVIYDVFYTIDAFGRRVTPVANREQRDLFILFGGGSLTYGEGVDDDETMPYQVGALTSRYVPYNYGFHGLGPFDILLKMESYDLKKQIREQDGIFIYTFIDDHINRTVGTMKVLGWKKDFIYYKHDDREGFVRSGTFKTARPATAFLYKLCNRSKIFSMLNIQLPVIKDAHVERSAKAIGAIKEHFQRQYPQGKFFVVVISKSKYGLKLVEYVDAMNIKNISVEGLFTDPDRDWFTLDGDPHPTPLAYRMIAEKIVTDLGLE